MKTIIYSEDAPEPIGPYSQAVKAGDLVFVSGQVPVDPISGDLIKGSIEEQAQLIFKHISAILETADSSLGKIIKVSIFLKNMDDFAKLNETYKKFFKSNFPARETVEVSRLPKDCDIEISVIAEC